MSSIDLSTVDFGAERITFDELFMTMAGLIARRSTCTRLQVGTIITSVDHRQVFSFGYNGNATGLPNECDSEDEGNCGCLHSEENAIINCTQPRYVPKIVYVTHSPCLMCTKRLINLGGVQKIKFKHLFREASHLKLFGEAGIQTTEL